MNTQKFYDSYEGEIKDPALVVPLLHKVIIALDTEVEAWAPLIAKIEHVQNCYLICGGILTPDEASKHAEAVIRCCLAFNARIAALNERFGQVRCQLSIGVNTGHVIGTIIGSFRKYFRIFGDTVNTASRVCTTGVKGRICVSESTRDYRDVAKVFDLREREPVFMKGKGDRVTWLVLGVRSSRVTASGRVVKLKRNKEWQRRHCGSAGGATSLLSMHFYQFLVSEICSNSARSVLF